MYEDANKKIGTIAYIVSMINGLESFIYREVDELYGKNFPITLFATKFKKGDIYSPKKEWPYYTYPVINLLLTLPWVLVKMCFKPGLLIDAVRNKAVIDLIFAIKFAPIMRRIGVKQIHCHFGDHKLFIGYYCKRLTGLPLSVTIHSHELHVNPNEDMFKVAILQCDHIFAISELAVNILTERYSVPSEVITLSKLSLDKEVWSKKKPVRVITVGRFQPQKGFDDLFVAAKLLKDEDVEFVVVGFGPLDLRSMAKEIGVEDKIVFFEKLGQSQLRLLYQSCDIYCLPSITHPEQGKEGIPVVLMEAMASGLPIVATDAGAVNELIEDTLVSERSPEQIANAIRTLIRDPELRQKQGMRNKEIVNEKHSLENVKQFGALLLELQNIENRS